MFYNCTYCVFSLWGRVYCIMFIQKQCLVFSKCFLYLSTYPTSQLLTSLYTYIHKVHSLSRYIASSLSLTRDRLKLSLSLSAVYNKCVHWLILRLIFYGWWYIIICQNEQLDSAFLIKQCKHARIQVKCEGGKLMPVISLSQLV